MNVQVSINSYTFTRDHRLFCAMRCLWQSSTLVRKALCQIFTSVYVSMYILVLLKHVQTSAARVVLPNLSQLPATALLCELHWLPVNSRITFKLACLTYKLLTASQPAYLHTLLHHYITTRIYGWLINFSSTWHNFPLNLVKHRLVTWLLQSGMDYLLISDFHRLLTPSNAVWKLNFSNSPSTPLLCCLHSDWFIHIYTYYAVHTYIHTVKIW